MEIPVKMDDLMVPLFQGFKMTLKQENCDLLEFMGEEFIPLVKIAV